MTQSPPVDEHALARLLLELAVILVAARVLAELARRRGQPGVLGELLAGILLGPTVLGLVAPGAFAALFPEGPAARAPLEAVSWLGMVLLLFLVGAETDLGELRRLGRAALLVSAGGIVLPFASGLALGFSLPAELVPAATTRATLAFFLATALSVSAMPVIAKILRDLDLARRDVGVITLAAAVADDTVGWILLSIVSGLAESATGSVASAALRTAVSVAGFALFGRFVLLPVLKRAARLVDDRFVSPGSDVALYASVALACAAASERLGLHAVFGAFVAGTVLRQVPRVRPRALDRIEALVGAVLAPVFFASVGLHVDLGAVHRPALLAVVLAIAVGTKVVGCFVGGRLGGLASRPALVVGVAMSARGAVELVVAVVGLSRGILSPELYAAIVLMAVGTSLLAPFLLQLAARGLPLGGHERKRLAGEAAERFLDLGAPSVLVPTAGGPNAWLGVAIASTLCKRDGATLEVIHVDRPDHPRSRRPEDEIDGHLRSLQRIAALLGASAAVRRVASDDVIAAVTGQARGRDLLVLGASNEARAIYAPLVEGVLRKAPCHAAVVWAHPRARQARFERLIVPLDGSVFARVALELAGAYAAVAEAEIVLLAPGEGEPVDLSLARDLVLASVTPVLGETVRVRIEIAGDDTREALRAVGADEDDLLILGDHNRAIGERFSLGTEVETLVATAPCSVAVVVPRLTP